jgi:N-acetylmuramoyl-L-alanine amidase
MEGEIMRKSIITFLLVCVIITVIGPKNAHAAGHQGVKVYIDGELLETEAPIELIDSTTYVPLRAVSEKLGQASVSWDGATQTAYVTKPDLTIAVKIGAQYLESNGRYLYMPSGCKLIDGHTLVPVRVLAKAFGASVTWDGETNSVHISSGSGTILPGNQFYRSDEVYWLSRIIYSESGHEPLKGQIAVGNVVLNRVASKSFPDTIYGVIFDRRYGTTQFSPVANGTIHNTPSELSVIAAKLCLEGYNVVGNSMFFLNPKVASSRWFDTNLTMTAIIGNHAFYS